MPTVTPEAGATYSIKDFLEFLGELIIESDVVANTSTTNSFTATWQSGSDMLSATVSGTGFSYAVLGGDTAPSLVGGTIQTVTGTVNGNLQGTISNIGLSASALSTAFLAEDSGSDPHAIEKLLMPLGWIYNGTSASDSIPLGSAFLLDGFAWNPSGDDEFNLNGGDDNIFAGDGNDKLFGGAGSDTLNGGAGSDTLVGNAVAAAQTADILIGGSGDDTFYAENSDTIMGGNGRDILYQVNDFAMTIDLGTTSIEYMQGGFNGDTINAATQTVGVEVYSGGGDDAITGSGFNDFLFSGVGDDTVNGGGGDDVILGDSGADSLSGEAGNDSIYVDAMDTLFNGGAGFDALYIGGDTGLTVDMGATSFEWLRGSTVGGDTVDASSQTQFVNVYASGGNDMVTGSGFNDFLWGEDGDDTLIGNAGDDVLVGGAGADTLTGGLGFDVLYANAGGGADGAVDTFVMTASWGTDILFDFENGTDKIDMSALGTNFAALTITTDGAHAHIRLGSDLISVADSAGLIDATDFLFV